MRLTIRRKPWPAFFELHPIPWSIGPVGGISEVYSNWQRAKIRDANGRCLISRRAGTAGYSRVIDVWNMYIAAAMPYRLAAVMYPSEAAEWTPEIVDMHPLPWTLRKAYLRPDGTRRVWLTDVLMTLIVVDDAVHEGEDNLPTLMYELSVILYRAQAQRGLRVC